jgi:pectin methylesterase-like acyl-CoA thioesterase
VYTNCQFIGIQDTVLAKSSAPTEQTRQYFSYDYITGSVDFVFGDATAVFDRDYLYEIDRGSVLGGNVVAPNTDSSKKYGLLIANSTLDSTAAANTFTLGRTWHNTSTAVGQTLVRNSLLPVGIKSAEPWTAIDPVNFPWTMGRFSEYHNGGAGSGVNSNRPQLSDSQAADYTTAAYLAGDDGWDPAW